MRRILVVEQDPAIASDLVEAIYAKGDQPIGPVNCFQAAMACADDNSPDLAVVGSVIDGESGSDIARCLHQTFGTRIIVLAVDDEASRDLSDIEHISIRQPLEPAAYAAVFA